ncbi:MAG: D-alanyl-D-alanine carboxypeptidase family protein [Rhodospirillaceae bacterium]
MGIRTALVRAAAGMLLLLLPTAAPAANIYASIVVEADTGRVLHERYADSERYPASLTKMMTLYLLFEAIENGELTMESEFEVSKRAAGQAPSRLGLRPGSKIKVEDALNALITKSANDVATVVAENLADKEYLFAVKMTRKARALGMMNTTFRNASGLPNSRQVSTARDMAILSARLFKDFPQYYPYFSRPKFSYGGRTYKSHNNLLGRYEGADGIKTGYTRASGFNLAASAEREGKRLVAVVLGGRSVTTRDRHLVDLLDKGFAVLSDRPDMVIAADRIEAFQDSSETTDAGPLGGASGSVGDVDDVINGVPGWVILEETWGIQIGAFSVKGTAQLVAKRAAEKLEYYGDVRPFVERVRIKGRTLYRARVLGLERRDLVRACSIVVPENMDNCLAVRPGTTKVASR